MLHMRFELPPHRVYGDLYKLVQAAVDSDDAAPYFVMTSNVDGMFEKNGFDKDRIFTPQGDFAYLQCATPCHNGVWPSKPVIEPLAATVDPEVGEVPEGVDLPTCPRCGGPATMNVRGGDWYVEEPHMVKGRALNRWLAETQRTKKRLAIIEVGAGFNTPVVIRWPVESIGEQLDCPVIRINLDHAELPPGVERGISLRMDADAAVQEMWRGWQGRLGEAEAKAADDPWSLIHPVAIAGDPERRELVESAFARVRAAGMVAVRSHGRADDGMHGGAGGGDEYERTVAVLRQKMKQRPRDISALREQLRATLVRLDPDPPLPDSAVAAVEGLLAAELEEKEAAGLLVDVRDTTAVPRLNGCPVAVWRGDITLLRVDAIVNAANSQLLGCFQPTHRCIDNVIHCAAGPRLREECSRIMKAQGKPEPPGLAKLTGAYALPASHVLHTVGPQYKNGTAGEANILALCYWNCLDAARDAGLRTLAFCCVSTGLFGYPSREAATVALGTVKRWLSQEENAGAMDCVILNTFDDENSALYAELAPGVFDGPECLEPPE